MSRGRLGSKGGGRAARALHGETHTLWGALCCGSFAHHRIWRAAHGHAQGLTHLLRSTSICMRLNTCASAAPDFVLTTCISCSPHAFRAHHMHFVLTTCILCSPHAFRAHHMHFVHTTCISCSPHACMLMHVCAVHAHGPRVQRRA